MNRKISLGAALALMILVATVTVTITWDVATKVANELMNALRERESSQSKYAEIDREVRANYNGTIDETQLLDNVARGYLAGIGDPYATYYDARTYERVQRALSNTTADIGAVLQADSAGSGYLTVLEVYPDSPAYSADIRAGDLIIKVDDTDLTAENSAQMLESIKGEAGTPISLTIRSGNTDRIEALARRVVATPSVYWKMLGADASVAYINIVEFNSDTASQFSAVYRRVKDQNPQSIIFDLRDNPGGRLTQTTKILDLLVPSGVIVSSQDKNGNINPLETSQPNEETLPMVVLVNGGTASSAELFAQVLRDYDKARIVGTLTTGKGVMQSIIPLTDGSALEITVATLVSPNGVIFNGVGVKPDYEVAMDMDWRQLGDNVSLDGQLTRAVEVAVAMHKTSEALQEMSQSEQSSPEDSIPPESSQPEVYVPEPSQAEEPSQGEEEEPSEGEEETSGDEEGETSDEESPGDETSEEEP